MRIFDCTLRDGANVVGNGFSPELTESMIRGLLGCGIQDIEMGNAKGIGSYDRGAEAPLDDESYAKLASRYADKGRLGMFMLAAFADADKIKMVKDNGLDFIRVGTAAGDGAKAVEAVKMVKAAGLTCRYSMMKAYPRGDAAGLVSAAAALGPVIPPSTVMIIYATTMSVPISELFVAGVTPGVLIAVLFCVINYYYAKKVWRLPKETKRYTFKESMRLTLKALPTLLLPVIILGGIYGGIFTPTEAGAIGAMYSVVLGIVYRSLTWKKLVDVFKKSLEASAMAGFLIGMSSIFCWIIAAAKIPAQIVDTLLPVLNGNTFFFWVAFLLILLVAGCVLEALSAVVILAPILIPVGLAMGLEPMHLAVVFCVTMTIGIVTPPFGGVLFTTVSITKTPFGEVAKGEIPYIFAMILVCVLIAIFPDLALWLPNLMQS